MRYRDIRVETTRDMLRVTLDRPGQGLGAGTVGELRHALDGAAGRPGLRLAVLAGRPGAFCTGMDLAAADEVEVSGEAFFGLLQRITALPLVVVAEVDGQVSGGGVGLAAACDLVHATPRSSFGLPEALWGVLPCVVLPFLERRVGPPRARAMTLTTQAVTAAEARDGGLVDAVADDPAVPLRRLADRLGRLDATTIGEAKRYFERLHPIAGESGRSAAEEFSRLLRGPVARARIGGYARDGRLPWETPPRETGPVDGGSV